MFQVPGIDSDKYASLIFSWQKGPLSSIEKCILSRKVPSLEELTALSTKFIESDDLEEKGKYFGLLKNIAEYSAKSLVAVAPIWGNGVECHDTAIAVDTATFLNNIGRKSAYNFPAEISSILEKAYFRPEIKGIALKIFEFFSMKPQCSISEVVLGSFVETIIDPTQDTSARQSHYKTICRLAKHNPAIIEVGERLFKPLLEEMKPMDPISGIKDFVHYGFKPSDELVSLIITRLSQQRLGTVFDRMQSLRVPISDPNIVALGKYLDSPDTQKDALDAISSISTYQEIPDTVRIALCKMIDRPEYSTLQVKIHETLSRGNAPFSDEMIDLISPSDKPLTPNAIKTLSSRGIITERVLKYLADSIWDTEKLQSKTDVNVIVRGLAHSSNFAYLADPRNKIFSLMHHDRCSEDIKVAYINSLISQARKGVRLTEDETKFIAENLSKNESEIAARLIPLVKDELLLKGNFFIGLLAPNAYKRELFLDELVKFASDTEIEPIARINADKILKLRSRSLVASSIEIQGEVGVMEISTRIDHLLSASNANYHFNREEVLGIESLLDRSQIEITKLDQEKVSSILAKVVNNQNNITSLKPKAIEIFCNILNDEGRSLALRYDACRALNQLIEMRCSSAICPEVANSMAVLLQAREDPLKSVAIAGFERFVKLDRFEFLEKFTDSLVQILPDLTELADLFSIAMTSLYDLTHRGGVLRDDMIEKLIAYSQDDKSGLGKSEQLSFLAIAHEAVNWNLVRLVAETAQIGEEQKIEVLLPKYLLDLIPNIESMDLEMQIFALKILNLHQLNREVIDAFPAGLVEKIIAQNLGDGIESHLRNEACILMSNLLMAGYIPSENLGNILSENLQFENSGELVLLRSTILASGFLASDEMIYGLSDIVASSPDSNLVAVAIITLMTAIESRDKFHSRLNYTQIAQDIESAIELEDKRLLAPIGEALEILKTKYGVEFIPPSTTEKTEVREITEAQELKIQTKPRSRTELVSELKALNLSDDRIQAIIESGALNRKLSNIDKFERDCQDWDASEITQWATNKGAGASIEEIIAVAGRANEIVTGGHHLRDTQKITALLLSEDGSKAHLSQMKAGEGKTATIAVLAIAKALKGQKVDVITSSPVLAIEAVVSKKSMYEMFGLRVAHNYMPDYHKGPKECYDADIVYGDSSTFQHDYLRHVYKKFNTRGDRDIFNCFAIVDEVDSMMLDEKDKIAKIASHSPGMEYLAPLLSMIWDKALSYRKVPDAMTFKTELESYGRALLEDKTIIVPKHLEEFAKLQMSNWADSVLRALSMSEEVDYVITTDGGGIEIIAPIDHENTGVTQRNTAWQNGLHQFLQMKHGLEVKAETLTSSFISNMSFFKLYGSNLCGLTGTLGSPEARALLAKVYNVDTFEIPTFQESKLITHPGIVTQNEEEWLDAISTRLHEEVDKRNGAALVICDSILSAKKIASTLSERNVGKNIRLYTRSDQDDVGLTDYITNGDIIVATNLAGRGTDIKTSEELEAVGGMFECTTFLSKNKRIAEQASLRTARQGNSGSCQVIINKEQVKYGGSSLSTMAEFEELRDKVESASIARVAVTRIPKILAEDTLQREFAEFAEEMNQIDGDKHKASSLEEKWGLWLKTHTKDDPEKFDEDTLRSDFEDFKRKMRAEYSKIDNPVYLARKAYDIMASGNYAGSYEYYEEAITKDPEYAFIAAYNMGYAAIRENNRNSRFYDDRIPARVSEHLSRAKTSIQSAIEVNSKMLAATAEGSATRDQLEAKINVLLVQKDSIEQAADVIAKMKKDQRIDIASHSKVHEILPSGPPYDGVVMEFAQAGLHIFYHLGAKPAPRDKAGMVVGMFAGALAAPFTAGLSVSLFGAGSVIGAGFTGMATSLAGTLGSNIYEHKGRLDLGVRDSFKARSLRSAALDGLSAGMFAGAVKGLKIGDLDKVTGVTRHTRIAQQHAVKAGIRVIVRGENVGTALKSEAINSATASIANKTADIAQEKGYGRAFKAGMHGITGGMSSTLQGGSFEQGFVAGAVTEVASMTPTGEQFATPLVATTSILMGGTEEDMARASSISSTIITYNHKLHRDKSPDGPDEGEAEDEELHVLNLKSLGDRGIDAQEQKISQIREEARILRDIANTTLEGKDQEFALLAASNYEAQAQDLSIPQKEFSDILGDVLKRNMVGMTPGVRVFGDLAGEVLSLTSDRLSRLISSNYYGRAVKATISSGATMFGRRVVSGAEEVFGKEAVQTTGDSLASAANATAEFADRHLAPGEQTLVKGVAVTLAGYGAGRVLGAARGTVRSQFGRVSGAADAFPTTKPVSIDLAGQAVKVATPYEQSIAQFYDGLPKCNTRYKTIVENKVVKGVADHAFLISETPTAVEAKFISSWEKSIYNPRSQVGRQPFAPSIHQKLVEQAQKYSQSFPAVNYHTNSREFAKLYNKVFEERGITNIKFIISPTKK